MKKEKITTENVNLLTKNEAQEESINQNKEYLNGSGRTRYSDEELHEFQILILDKLKQAKNEAQNLQEQLKSANSNGTDDTARTFKLIEDGSDHSSMEDLGQMISRIQKFIQQLEHALLRIETKTYGICHITGKLIPKERLKIVPHTTQCIEAKMNPEKQ
jgi:DnaK suppressor protein